MKKNSILVFFLFVLVVPFLTLATLSRFNFLEINTKILLIASPLCAVILTLAYWLYFSRTGKEIIKTGENRFKKLWEGVLWISASCFVLAFMVISTLDTYNILRATTVNTILISIVVTAVAAVSYYFIRKNKYSGEV